jgi:flagellar biosynthesis protein FlhF
MELEVTASAEVEIPSRLVGVVEPSNHETWEDSRADASVAVPDEETETDNYLPAGERLDYRELFLRNLKHSNGLDLSQQEPSDQEPESASPLAAEALQLEATGLPATLLDEFQRQTADDDHANWKLWLQSRLNAELNIIGPTRVPRNRRTVAAVVGPTGVGKTTTLAKLAASFRLDHHRKVGLVTVDTYRVGAVDQLRAYAEIMDLPMEVVSSPREMRDALSRLHECEIVLIDTAGRSQRDHVQMRELGALLSAACPDEVHLVASAVAETESLQETVTRFREAGANRLILTKTDEATRPGRLFSFLRTAELPLSYVTNGQNVPADFRPATGERLVDWMLNERPAQDL